MPNCKHQDVEIHPHHALQFWIKHGRNSIRQAGLTEQCFQILKVQANGAFVDALVKFLFEKLNLTIQPGFKKVHLARKLVLENSTLIRLMSGQQLPSFHTLVTIYAANGVEWPPGWVVTLHGFTKTFQVIEQKLRGVQRAIHEEHALCLYCLVRNEDWYRGHVTGDSKHLERGAERITSEIRGYYPDSDVSGVSTITKLHEDYIDTWAVLELLLAREWL